MKLARLALVVVFMCTWLVVPAQAKESSQYGFLPLVTQADPAMPLALQAQQAFNRLLPDLLAAQESGAILSFEPDFGAGILQVEYPAGAQAALPAALQGLKDIQAAVRLVPHKMPAAAKPGDAIMPGFSAELFSQCFDSYGLGASSHVVGTLSNPAGQTVASYTGDADSYGNLIESCFAPAGPHAVIRPGYKMSFTIYDTSSAPLGTYSVVIPNIAFTSYNRATGSISGLGPANKVFSLAWEHPNLDAAQMYTTGDVGSKVPATGKWTINFNTKKFRGGDLFDLWVTMNSTFMFNRNFYLPYISCGLGTNACSVYGFPQQAVTLNVVHAGKTYKFTGKFGNSGEFDAKLLNASHKPILLAAGDRVTASGIPGTYILPKLTAVVDITTSMVSGKAPASRYFRTWVQSSTNGYQMSIWTGSNTAGNYSADFSLFVDLQTILPFTVKVDTIDRVFGNETTLTVPVTQ